MHEPLPPPIMPHNEPLPVNISPELFAVGRYIFQLASRDATLLHEVSHAFLQFHGSWARHEWLQNPTYRPVPDIVNIDRLLQHPALTPSTSMIAHLIWYVMDRAMDHHVHYECAIGMEAVLLLTMSGTPVWLFGGSQNGKSTLAVALALGLGWTIVSEDYVFIHHTAASPYVVPVVAPISLRAGAARLIHSATGVTPEPILCNRWFWRPDLFHAGSLENTTHALVIHLRLTHAKAGEMSTLDCKEVSWPEFFRGILPITNAHMIQDGVKVVHDFLSGSRCILMNNGDLRSRIDAITTYVS